MIERRRTLLPRKQSAASLQRIKRCRLPGGVGPIIYTTTTSTSDAKKWEYVSKDADTLYPLKIFIGSSALHGWSSEDVWPDSSVYLARSKLPDDPILVRFWRYLARSNCIMLCYVTPPRWTLSSSVMIPAHLHIYICGPGNPANHSTSCRSPPTMRGWVPPLPWPHGATRHARLHTRVDEDHKTSGPTGTTHQKAMEEREPGKGGRQPQHIIAWIRAGGGYNLDKMTRDMRQAFQSVA